MGGNLGAAPASGSGTALLSNGAGLPPQRGCPVRIKPPPSGRFKTGRGTFGLGPRGSVNRRAIGKEDERADATATGLETENVP